MRMEPSGMQLVPYIRAPGFEKKKKTEKEEIHVYE